MIKNNKGWGPGSIGSEFRKGISTHDENTSSVGNLNNPVLDLPLTSSLDYSTGSGEVNYTCSTKSTYINRYGVLKYAEIDEPRFEKKGLLLEGKSTNLQIRSNDLNFWDKNGSCTVVQGAISPDGTNNAWTVSGASSPSNSGGSNNLRTPTISLSTNDIVSVSVWVRSISGSVVNARYATISVESAYVNTNSTKWTRLVNTLTISSDASSRFILYTNDGSDFEVAFAQVEYQSFTTSYIPTTSTPVLRDNNICTLTAEGNIGRFADAISTVLDFDYFGTNSVSYQEIFRINNNGYLIYRIFNNSSVNYYYAGAHAEISEVALEVNNINRIGAVVTSDEDISEVRTFNNGQLFAFTTTEVFDNSNIPDIFYIGGNSAQSKQLFGHIKNIKIYDRALSDEEMRIA